MSPLPIPDDHPLRVTPRHEERLDLWALKGQRVEVSAIKTIRRRDVYTRLTGVQVEGVEGGLSHAWVKLPPVMARLPAGARLTFRALVAEYVRSDGTVDIGFIQLQLVSVRTSSSSGEG